MAVFMSVRREKEYRERRRCREVDCKALYLFEERNLMWLADNFLGNSGETRGGALTSYEKMKIFLRYLSDPGFQCGVGEDHGVHQCTVSRTVKMVAKKITQQAHLWIRFPQGQEDLEECKEVWLRTHQFPCAIGALDCTHIKILKPAVHGYEYVNRKGVPSINVQAACDGAERFTSMDIQWPGSVHDSRIWRNSDVFQVMRTFDCAILLGDQGYGISPWLMVPFKEAVTPTQIAYNRLHSAERAIIERCFGQLKRRFPMLQYVVRVNTEDIPQLILSAAILHNVAKFLNDPNIWENEREEENDPENSNREFNIEEDKNIVRERGIRRREEIAELIHRLGQ